MTLRDTVLERVDALAFFAREGLELRPLGGAEYRFLCPFHEDTDPSANVNVNSKLWNCHACGKGGSLIDFLMERRPGPSAYREALADLAAFAGVSLDRPKSNGQDGPARPATKAPAKMTEENVAAWHEAAKRNPDLMRWFTEKRGYSVETVERWQLGWDGQRVTIPIRDEGGTLVNIRRYRDPREKTTAAAGKMIGIASGMNEARLFPWDALSFEEIVLVEGEWDALIMQQYGFPNALTVTSGAGIFKPEWVPLFDQKRVTILYDNDDAGRRGAQRVAAILSRSAQVSICQVPGLPEKGDVTDFFVEQGRSVEELRTLLDEASPYLLAEVPDSDTPATTVRLHEASDARYQRQKLLVPVLLSGKATTPYTVPYKYTAKCDLSNKRYCSFCPLNDVGGVRKVTLAPSDPAVLQLIGVTTQQQAAALKVLAKAVPQCNRPVVEIEESINIEELRIIPELDNGAEAGDTEYVTRTGYFLGHGLRANRSYKMVGYAHPHPKTQGTVHLLSEAIPSQDNVSAFTVSADMVKRLRAFQGDPATVFGNVYEDFRKTVHRIQDRPDMQVAYDLAWHSAIAFYFNGAFVRRGWVEVMVMGDSGQGKTEMAMALLAHYKMGARVQAEQASTAGLIGGLEKMGDSWMLSWGQVPLNDKRLLVIDETQGLPSAQIESMSDVRATGVAEITKIRTERTNARCRLVWLANPVSGLTLSQHNQGVLAIKDLFKKPEDIRRLDFAITVASGDVRLERVNVLHDETQTDPVHVSDDCRDLVLWAWSRLPHQIEFSPDAIDLILSEATRMGRKYHAAIPLVEPSDQRLKLARLAVACAARCFSSPDGERLVVEVPHVRFVVDFLERIYNAPSMSYGEYSETQRKGESLTDDETIRVRAELTRWHNGSIAIDFFRSARIFKKTDLVDVVGWDEADAKAQLRFLASNRLIRPTREGYAKTAAFISLLRLVGQGLAAGNDESLPDEGNAPF